MLLVALFGIILPIGAESVGKKHNGKTYIAEGKIDLTQFLPPPPNDTSLITKQEEAKAELRKILNLDAGGTHE